VDQQLAEPPALQLGALGFECFSERLGCECSGGHQLGAELGTAARHRDRVDQAALEIDEGFLARGVVDVEATARGVLGEFEQQRGERSRGQVAFEHERPPLPA